MALTSLLHRLGFLLYTKNVESVKCWVRTGSVSKISADHFQQCRPKVVVVTLLSTFL